MQEQTNWLTWVQFLQRWGLNVAAAAFLEAAGPLNLFLAQALYAGEPLLGNVLPCGQWQALAKLLEDRSAIGRFAALLREEE